MGTVNDGNQETITTTELPSDLTTLAATLKKNEDKSLLDILKELLWDNNFVPKHPETQHIQQYSFGGVISGRPLNSAMILLAGESGTGKSTMINRLFDDDNLCPVNDHSSQTEDVTQYIKNLTVTDIAPPFIEAQLTFVDIPGAMDTDRTKEAPNYRHIEHFRKECKVLKTRKLPPGLGVFKVPNEVFPNTVLFTFNATNKRMDGPDSNFVKSLQLLKKQKFVDTAHPNLIMVGTHALGLGCNKTKYTEKTNALVELVKKLVLQHVEIHEVQVVFVENEPADHDLEKEDGVVDFYRLPDGTYSHANVLQAMFNLYTKSNDKLARLLTSWYFGLQCPDRHNETKVVIEAELVEEGTEAEEELSSVAELMAELKIAIDTPQVLQEKKQTQVVKPQFLEQPVNAPFRPMILPNRNAMSSVGVEIAKLQDEGAKCFPGWVVVSTRRGMIRMDQLQIGDYLQTLTEYGAIKWTQCYGFAHRSPDAFANFLQLQLTNGKILSVSADHLLIVIADNGMIKYKTGSQVVEGDWMLYHEHNGEVEKVQVSKISLHAEFGVYCPLTIDGTLLADGVMVTCYADIDHFKLAHLAFAPLRYRFNLEQKFGKHSYTIEKDGIHPYAKFLMKARSVLSKFELH